MSPLGSLICAQARFDLRPTSHARRRRLDEAEGELRAANLAAELESEEGFTR